MVRRMATMTQHRHFIGSQKIGWLKPVATALFVVEYNPAMLPGLDKLATRPPGEFGARTRYDGHGGNVVESWAVSFAHGGKDASARQWLRNNNSSRPSS